MITVHPIKDQIMSVQGSVERLEIKKNQALQGGVQADTLSEGGGDGYVNEAGQVPLQNTAVPDNGAPLPKEDPGQHSSKSSPGMCRVLSKVPSFELLEL